LPDKGDARVAAIEAHEDFLQHVEDGRSKIRLLSVITVVVAFLLAASYAYQLLLPLATGTKVVEVNLTDPALIASEVVFLILAGAWLYVGILNYLFSTRLGRSIQKARAMEREVERRIDETPGNEAAP
jgi:hypothetical protein